MTALSYCTNVHPAEDLDGVVAQFDRYAEPVRRLVGTDVLGLGLWLPASLAAVLADDRDARRGLRAELDARGLEVYTLNAFPYGGFHDDVVKHAVYQPQWTDPRRLEYTVDCAIVLADLLPDSARYGSISTLPLAWRTPWDEADDDAAAGALAELTGMLDGMAQANGRPIRLAVEPEPGCVLDSVADAVAWLAPRVDPRYVGLCLDTCHLAVSFADPARTVAAIYDAGLSVVKVQASAALQVDEPGGEPARLALADFTEPRYLHQVRERTGDGDVVGADDIPQALTELPAQRAWRVHFHVPLHARPAAPLSATTDVLRGAITALESAVATHSDGELPHIEVETYTWSVLPETAGGGGDTALIRGIAAELRWAAAQLFEGEFGERSDGAFAVWTEEHRRKTASSAGAERVMTQSTQVAVLDVVGLTPKLLAHMPNLAGLARRGWQAELGTVLPAVTCSAQSTFLTGKMPAEHGIVGNGWYFRELGEVFLWRQHNRLVAGDKVWETARARNPDHTTANVCWWYAMGATTDITVTPRPIYHADGRKSPDAYVRPPALHDELVGALGEFPLFQYWGPTASLASSEWIIGASRKVFTEHHPDLLLVYVPHLDYDLQRFGPDGPEAVRAARELDDALAPLLGTLLDGGATVVALSEYGITPVRRPVDINRLLRREGLLEVYTQAGMEYLDPWTSRAFAVADHQVAHVYVNDPADLPRVRDMLATLSGVDEVLDREAQGRYGVDHPRAGELVVVAEPDAWFTYYYWLDDDRAPDFARGVEIHRKPGYDPAELFFDPADRLVKAKAGLNLVRKKVGLRYAMNVVPLDPSHVRGSHGRLPISADDGPVLLCSAPDAEPGGALAATDVHDLLLQLQGIPDVTVSEGARR